jgi:hypothetical protein
MILLDRLLLPVFVELIVESGERWTGGLRPAEKEIVRGRGIWGFMNGCSRWLRYRNIREVSICPTVVSNGSIHGEPGWKPPMS